MTYIHPITHPNMPHLQVVNGKWIFIDISSISPRSQSRHGSQISTISPHCFNDENPALCSSGGLLDPIACLKRHKTDN